MTDYLIFLQACQEIGGTSDSNGNYQRLLYEMVGPHWRHMSVADLLAVIEQARKVFNVRVTA